MGHRNTSCDPHLHLSHSSYQRSATSREASAAGRLRPNALVATKLPGFTSVPRAIAFIPIYPNKLPNVPKPSRASRTAPLVFSNLPASQSAITRLENRSIGVRAAEQLSQLEAIR